MGVDELGRRTELDDLARGELAQHFTKPVHTLHPPVPEELGVICCADHAKPPGPTVVRTHLFFDQRGEMARLLEGSLGCTVGLALGLIAEVDPAAGNAPVL